MPSNHLILCHPLLLLPSIFPNIRVSSNESTLHIRWPKYWSFSFSISPSNAHPGLIFRMDWLELLAVQGTLKSLLQHHSSKASILLCSAFFIVQLSHPYMTTRKTIALTRWTFVDKVVSLLFNMLSRLVITFLPRSKHLLRPFTGLPWSVSKIQICRCDTRPCLIVNCPSAHIPGTKVRCPSIPPHILSHLTAVLPTFPSFAVLLPPALPAWLLLILQVSAQMLSSQRSLLHPPYIRKPLSFFFPGTCSVLSYLLVPLEHWSYSHNILICLL